MINIELECLACRYREAYRQPLLACPQCGQAWFEARDALVLLGCELARVARCPLVLDYRWKGETSEVPLATVDELPLPTAFEGPS